jgi:hypothetical protein
MMTDEEKKQFMKRMGYNPRLLDPEPHVTKRKTRENILGPDGLPKGHVDKQELLSVYRIFHKDENKET